MKYFCMIITIKGLITPLIFITPTISFFRFSFKYKFLLVFINFYSSDKDNNQIRFLILDVNQQDNRLQIFLLQESHEK